MNDIYKNISRMKIILNNCVIHKWVIFFSVLPYLTFNCSQVYQRLISVLIFKVHELFSATPCKAHQHFSSVVKYLYGY